MSTLPRQPRLPRSPRDRYRAIAERYVTSAEKKEVVCPGAASNRRSSDAREPMAGHFPPLVPANKLSLDGIDLPTSEHLFGAIPPPASVSVSTHAVNAVNAESRQPAPEFFAVVEQWPPLARAFLRDLARRLAGELECSELEAELVAFNSVFMGYAGPVPAVEAEQRADGSWPEWAETWPGTVTWRFYKKPCQIKKNLSNIHKPEIDNNDHINETPLTPCSPEQMTLFGAQGRGGAA